LVCVGLRRIVTVAFLRRVQIFLLTYLLNEGKVDCLKRPVYQCTVLLKDEEFA